VFFVQHYALYNPKNRKENVFVVRRNSIDSGVDMSLFKGSGDFISVFSMCSDRFPVNYRDADAILRTPIGSINLSLGRTSLKGTAFDRSPTRTRVSNITMKKNNDIAYDVIPKPRGDGNMIKKKFIK